MTRKNNKYARIRTTAELDAAIREAHARRERLGASVGQDYSNLQQSLRPATLVSNALLQVAPYFSITEIGLGLVRGLKRLIAPKEKNVRSAALPSSQPAEESPSASES